MDKNELIFNMYKNNVIVSKNFKDEIKEKYGLSNKEAADLFVKITNYQIKKYGGRLGRRVDDKHVADDSIYQAKLTDNIKHYKRYNI